MGVSRATAPVALNSTKEVKIFNIRIVVNKKNNAYKEVDKLTKELVKAIKKIDRLEKNYVNSNNAWPVVDDWDSGIASEDDRQKNLPKKPTNLEKRTKGE